MRIHGLGSPPQRLARRELRSNGIALDEASRRRQGFVVVQVPDAARLRVSGCQREISERLPKPPVGEECSEFGESFQQLLP